MLGAIAALGLPQLHKMLTADACQRGAGRAMRIGDMSIKPWSLELRLDDLAIAGPPDAGTYPLLQVARIHSNLSIATLLKRAWWRRSSSRLALPAQCPQQ